MATRLLRAAGALFLFLAAAFDASAQSLVVLDCNGFTRAARNVDPGELSRVEMQVSSATGAAVEGAQVQIVHVLSGNVQTVVVENGKIVVESLAPGVYTVSSTSTELAIGAISIGPAGFATAALVAAGAGTAIGGGGLIVATSLAVEQSVNDDSSGGGGNGDGGDGGEGGGPGQPGGEEPPPAEPPPAEPPSGTGSGGGGGGGQAEDVCCDPQAQPDPIDDFFGDGTAPVKVLSPSS